MYDHYFFCTKCRKIYGVTVVSPAAPNSLPVSRYEPTMEADVFIKEQGVCLYCHCPPKTENV